jgi:EAL domain-containing protein (putative c-di-GMP-specific phosphodiesterase class I)
VRLSDGACLGMATSLRWHHPVDGVLSPEHIRPQIEACGLLPELAQSLLVQGLGALRSWKLAGWDLRLSMELFEHQLHDPGFANALEAQFVRLGVEPLGLILSINRGAQRHDLVTLGATLGRLQLKGFGLSIDDVGVGHQLLAQLRDLPFEALHLVPSFLHDCVADSFQRAVFKATISVAHELGLLVVASGVESESDWRFLRNSECDTGQGTFIARPMPGEAIADWMHRWPGIWQKLSEAAVA